ncbi:hypothetical protein [Massilia rhizosphaerae]|uniref:hypothetical protein n=1 Tax=Massilia rhizosphaerae TaxID=2784389 RepID=UPI0018DEBEF9|nr:hypothetical protein [Massilia rhizosphaerae]
MKSLLTRYFSFLRGLLKILLPIALLACFGAPFFGYLVRWAPADEALARYKDETAVMVGGSYRSHTWTSDKETQTLVFRERVYVLFPSILRELKTVTVSQQNNEHYKTSEDQNGVANLLVMYGLILFGNWWFWVRKPVKPGFTR